MEKLGFQHNFVHRFGILVDELYRSEPLKTKQPQLRLLVGFAQGIVTGLLLQGQMAGLHTETYSPSRLTFYFLGAKVDIFNNTAIETKKSNI